MEYGVGEFLGRGWKFPPQVDQATGKMQTVSYEEDISEAVRIILFTRKGERVMRPNFGSTIYDYMFSAMNYTDRKKLEGELEEALVRFEPRITNPRITVNVERLGEGLIHVEVSYVVRSTNNPYNLVFPYYLNEGI